MKAAANLKKQQKNRGAQRKSGWPPGTSGNPRGRPRGSRNKVTLAVEALLEGQAEALTHKLIERALEGSVAAMELVFARLAPVRKERTIAVDLPKLGSMGDVMAGYDAVIGAVANGEISTTEGTALGHLLEMRRRALEAVDLEKRIEAVEARIAAAGGARA